MPSQWGAQQCHRILKLIILCIAASLGDESCGEATHGNSANLNISWAPKEYFAGVEVQVTIPPLFVSLYQLRLLGKVVDQNATSMTVNNCSSGVYFCSNGPGVLEIDKSIVFTGLSLSLCGLFNSTTDEAIWGLEITTLDESRTTTAVDYLPIQVHSGYPVGLIPGNEDRPVKSGYQVTPPIQGWVCDAWGNRNYTVSDVVVQFECDYNGYDPNFKLFGSLTQNTINGTISFPNVIVTGKKGLCTTRFESPSLVYLPGLSDSTNVNIIISFGDAHLVSLTLIDGSQVTILHENALTLTSTLAVTDFNIAVEDVGGNILGYSICNETDWQGEAHVIHQKAGILNCILLDISWVQDPHIENIPGLAVSVPSTADQRIGRDYMTKNSNVEEIPGRGNETAYRLRTSDITGTIKLFGRLYSGQGLLEGYYQLTIIDKGEFQCLLPKTGDSLLTEDIAGEVLDATTMDEIERTFFDLEVPPAPFVRFNVSARNWRDHHLLIPASYQYWVLMQSPFFIEVDPVLSTYFCFGFNYARVSDLAISLRKPFCGSSQLLKVVSELAILFFDLGDSSAQFHKTRGSFSGTEGTAKFGNHSGFIPRIEKLAICVGDRILSPATTGYHIQCCKRDTGECQDGSRGHSLQTAVIVIATIVTTLASISHTVWVVKSISGCFRMCIRFTDLPVSDRAKVVVVHVLCVLVPVFSVVVNRDYVAHLHPLTILWSAELLTMGSFLLICFARLFYQHPKLKVAYDFSLVAVGFVSLWLVWAAWTWTVPALFLQTRRTLVPFTCFSTMIAHCIVKPGVIAQFHKNNIGALSLASDGHDMILDSLITTMLFAGFLSGLVYSLNSFEVVTDTQVILSVLVVLGVGVFLSWSFSARFSAALRRTILDSRWFAEKAAMVVNMQRDAVEQAADFIEEETRPARKQSSNALAQIMSVFTGGQDEEDEEYTEAELQTPFIRRESSATGDSSDSHPHPYSPPTVAAEGEIERSGSPPVTLPPATDRSHVSFEDQQSKRKGILKPKRMARKTSILVIKDALSNVMNEVMSPAPSVPQSPMLSPSNKNRRSRDEGKQELPGSNRSSRSPLTLANLLASKSRNGRRTPRTRSPQLSVTSQDTAPSYRWTSLPTSPEERPDPAPDRHPSLLFANQNSLPKNHSSDFLDVPVNESTDLLAPTVRSQFLNGVQQALLKDEKHPEKDDRWKEQVEEDNTNINISNSDAFRTFADMAEMVDDDEYQHLVEQQQQQMSIQGGLPQVYSFRKVSSVDAESELYASGNLAESQYSTPVVTSLPQHVEVWSRLGIPSSPETPPTDESPLNDLLKSIPRVESISASNQLVPTPVPTPLSPPGPKTGSAAMPPISPVRSPMQAGVDVNERRSSDGRIARRRSSNSPEGGISPVQSPIQRSTDTSPELVPQLKSTTDSLMTPNTNNITTPNSASLPRRKSGPISMPSPKSPSDKMVSDLPKKLASIISPRNAPPPSPSKGGSNTNPLLAGALEEADKLLAALQKSPQPHTSTPPSDGWVEGGTWDSGKWHPTRRTSASAATTPIARSLSSIGTQFSARLKARVAEHSADDHHTAELKRTYKTLVKRAQEKKLMSPRSQQSPTAKESPREYFTRVASDGNTSPLNRERTVPQQTPERMVWRRDAQL